MDARWIVVLEAAGGADAAPFGTDSLRHLLEELGEHDPTVLHDVDRYALQVRIDAETAAEALFFAVARWRHAVRTLGLPVWALARAEVMTVDEYEADLRVPSVDRVHDGGRRSHEPHAASSGEELLRRVFTDSLTGLATRELFLDRVRVALARAAEGTEVGILLIDVDGFAAVNHEVGYAAGDQMLVALAARLTQLVAGALATARVGGDTFAVLVTEPEGDGYAGAAAGVLDGVRAPVEAGGRLLRVTASVGVATSSSAGADADKLIGEARVALSAAKAAGGDGYRLFEPGLPQSPGTSDLDDNPAADRMAYVVLLERAALAANEAPGLEAAAASVLQQVCALTGWITGHLWVTDGRGGLASTGVWNASAPARLGDFRDRMAGTVAAGAGLPGLVLATGQPAWTEDLTRERHAVEAGAVEAGLRTALAFPLSVRRRVVAVLEFFSERRLSVDDLLTDVMASVCAQLGRVVERGAAEAALLESEEQYRTLAELAPMMIWRCGPDGRGTFLNSTGLEFTGRTLEEALGDGWLEILHPEDRPRYHETSSRAFERREPFELEYRLRRADGEYRWVLTRGRPVGEGDAYAGYVGSCIDVTERRNDEQEARRREARFRALVQNTDIMIIVLGADGAVVEEYAGTFDLGYGAASGPGRSILSCIHPDDLERAGAELARVVSQPGPGRPFRCRARHADGSWRSIQAVANNLLDDPTVAGIVLTVADVTDRGRAEEPATGAGAHLREVQALAGTGSWWHDLATGAVFWSDELYRILGRSRPDLAASAEGLLAAVHPEDRDRVAAVLAPADPGGTGPGPPATLEFRIVQPGGAVRRVLARSSFLRDEAGRPVRAVGTLVDLDG